MKTLKQKTEPAGQTVPRHTIALTQEAYARLRKRVDADGYTVTGLASRLIVQGLNRMDLEDKQGEQSA
jgi:hypothetical protein